MNRESQERLKTLKIEDLAVVVQATLLMAGHPVVGLPDAALRFAKDIHEFINEYDGEVLILDALAAQEMCGE